MTEMLIALSGLLLAMLASPEPSPAETPCGFVDFRPYATPSWRGGTVYELISATVTFPDGDTETARIPYPWVYPDGERTDPWSDTNLRKPNYAITMQLPPPGFDRSTLPPLIAYILAHTDARGYTTLRACSTNSKGDVQPPWPDGTVDVAAVVDPGARIYVRPFSVKTVEGQRVRLEGCAELTNRSDQAVRRVRLLIRGVNTAGGEVAATALAVDRPLLPREGTARAEELARLPDPSLCAQVADDAGPPPPARRIVKLVFSVTEVDFDGGSWRAPVVPKTKVR